MKCIVKKTGLAACLTAAALLLQACGQEIEIENSYDVFSATEKYGITAQESPQIVSFFAENLCVGGTENITDEAVSDGLFESGGIFNTQDRTVEYAKNIHEKLYPASTTKILTAFVALKYGNLSDTTTVSENALDLEEGSTTCGLSVGDQITLEQLLYGLMLRSGNDAAVVIAEMISGDMEAFAQLMNQEAIALGATESHFVNPHGLQNEEHYTTLYDLYLIFNGALQNETFRQILNSSSYTAEYKDSNGEVKTEDWKSTNKYLNEEEETPEGVTVIGGKTGTTSDAGYCLVLLSENSSAKPYISIILKAESRDDLYGQMSELLKKTSN